MYGIGDAISTVFWGMVFLIVLGFASCSYFAAESIDKDDNIPALGNSIENMEKLKQECEKSLPRDKECVLIYEYVPVNTESEK